MCVAISSLDIRVVLWNEYSTDTQPSLRMPDWSWATEVITWEQAKEFIVGGTVESFAKLRRSEQQLTTYRAFMDKIRQDYASVADYIKISVLDRACRINPDGKKEAVDVEHGTAQLVWHLNDFPYFFEDDVQHWLLWSTAGPLDHPLIEQQVQLKFPDKESIIFVNPAALMSVKDVWHCHVLVRPKRQQQQQPAS